MSEIWPYLAALLPSAGVAWLFYLVIKNMIEGDRKERLAIPSGRRNRKRSPSTGMPITRIPENWIIPTLNW